MKAFICRIIDRLRRRAQFGRVTRLLRGYRVLQSNQDPEFIRSIRVDIQKQHLSIPKDSLSDYIFGAIRHDREIVVRQYAVSRLAMHPLFAQIVSSLAANGRRTVYCLPKEWRSVLAMHGLTVAEFPSRIRWIGFILVSWTRGVAQILALCVASLPRSQARAPIPRKHIHLVGLTEQNLPKTVNSEGSTCDIVSWVADGIDGGQKPQAVSHALGRNHISSLGDTQIVADYQLFSPLGNVAKYVQFLMWGAMASLRSAVDMMRGRWWHALMLAEAAKYKQTQLQEDENLADEYWFHNSGTRYRPMWTYDCDYRNINVIMYFYSTNMEGYKKRNGSYPVPPLGWHMMTWPQYYVWDDHQKRFLERIGPKNPSIKVVGPIPFSDIDEPLSRLPRPIIGVFDIQPVRASIFSGLGLEDQFYRPAFSIRFLGEIQKACQNVGVPMLFKSKRDIGKSVHPAYKSNIDREISADKSVHLIKSDISAHRIIPNCSCVVSAPYTSTALIAKALGIPTCYFDPTGSLMDDDAGAHGVEIILSTEGLENWLSAHHRSG
ncbi:MAG: polysaccharide biosynthesis PFTS motif protein [Rhizobiales bacterium]|nr:polysaccharide biosynthesis PFTS motif protein [Hyphomicrobiales bacterium]MBO6698967.1 polysaccharide biosynthesis PFTS motif protein [Hyphomicrobiales bacterium]MBO6734780.1 polysaccharide biosynthesis PFTS motif protein [Hyphomicrobiales bacterium]MBO6911414.1 polysaccharide biosynthesis PFTS motif protein [Hyphomicrobiales bacterium]